MNVSNAERKIVSARKRSLSRRLPHDDVGPLGGPGGKGLGHGRSFVEGWSHDREAPPFCIGQAPIFRSSRPPEDGVRRSNRAPSGRSTPTLTARLAMWRSTVLGDTIQAGSDVPGGASSASCMSTSASRGVTLAAVNARGQARCRPPAAGYRCAGMPEQRSAGGGHRRWSGGVEEVPVRRPANASGLPTGRDGRLGHQSAGMVAVPVAGGKIGVGSGEGLLGLGRVALSTQFDGAGVAHPAPNQPVHGQTRSLHLGHRRQPVAVSRGHG